MQKSSTTKVGKLRVGQRVKAGRFLGFQDQVGCAPGSHFHFELGVPRASDPIAKTGGCLKDNSGSKRNRIPRICGISVGIFASGKTYKARKVPALMPVRPAAEALAFSWCRPGGGSGAALEKLWEYLRNPSVGRLRG